MNANLHVVEHIDGPPSPQPPPLTEGERREVLREALDRRDASSQRRDKAKSALERAEAMLSEAEGELGHYAQLDDQIARGRADAIATSLASGLAPILDTPRELAELVKRQSETRNKIAAIKSAVAKLRSDFDSFHAEYDDADQAARNAALAVMASGAEVIIAKMLRHEEKAAALRKRVSAYLMQRRTFFGLRSDAIHQFLAVTSEHGKALRAKPANAVAEADSASSAQWRALFDALLEDSDAPFDK